MPARSAATAVLALVVLASGCVEAADEAEPRTGRVDVSRVIRGVDPGVHRPVDNRPTGVVLPPSLGGYPAMSTAGTRLSEAGLRAAQRDPTCAARGQGPAPSNGFGGTRTEGGVYAAGMRPVLWVAVLRGVRDESTSGSDGRGIRGGRCRDVEYVVRAGGLEIAASWLWIRDVGGARLLRTRVPGDLTLVIACTSPIQDSTCGAAMAELVHFLGV